MFAKIKRFVTTAVRTAVTKVKNFIKGVYQHAETITVLVLATFGVNALIGELPFLFMLPMWVEATMVIPVLSVLIVSLLIKLGEWRATRRNISYPTGVAVT